MYEINELSNLSSVIVSLLGQLFYSIIPDLQYLVEPNSSQLMSNILQDAVPNPVRKTSVLSFPHSANPAPGHDVDKGC